jgi:mRNA-degrading endonuclease RelE of RelBE toxin-antitoxin system
MAKVIVTKKLEEEINKIFKKESTKIFESMFELEQNPHKGKSVGQVGGTVIKELRYEGYRFYFITDGFKIKMLQKEELNDLLIKFVRLSDKKDQQKVIDEIRNILKNLGEERF